MAQTQIDGAAASALALSSAIPARMALGPTALGAVMLGLGMSLLPVADAIARHVIETTGYAPATMAWFRLAIGAVVILPLVATRRAPGFRTIGEAATEVARAGALTLAIVFMIAATARTALANAYGGFFICPAVAALLAAALLRERVRLMDWAAIALGFVGVLLVTRPSAAMDAGVAFALAGGACYALFLTLTRLSRGRVCSLSLLSTQLAIGVALLTPAAVRDLAEIGVVETPWLLAMAAASLGCNVLAIAAYRIASATALAPVVYVQIVSAVAVGFIVYGERPDLIVVAGLALTLLSGALRFLWRRG